MHSIEALRDAVLTYACILLALFVAQVSTLTAVGAFFLLVLKIMVELPKAIEVLRTIRQRMK